MITWNTLMGITKGRPQVEEPDWFAPVDGDEIDELVNWQLEQGKADRH